MGFVLHGSNQPPLEQQEQQHQQHQQQFLVWRQHVPPFSRQAHVPSSGWEKNHLLVDVVNQPLMGVGPSPPLFFLLSSLSPAACLPMYSYTLRLLVIDLAPATRLCALSLCSSGMLRGVWLQCETDPQIPWYPLVCTVGLNLL